MNIGDIVVLDATSKKAPYFLERDPDPNQKAFIKGEIRTADDEVWACNIIEISTTGKYTVKLTEKIH